MSKARITEIFSSVQGEGLYAGEWHTFVRFYGCNLACRFCDESEKTDFSEYSVDEVVARVINERRGTIALTGGEPLLQVGFLKELFPILRMNRMKIYLETNGTLKNNLMEILDYADIISMDFKLPSSAGLRPYWDEHLEFLKEADRKEVFVKAVVTAHTSLSDLKTAVSIVKSIDRNIPFIIQPVSYDGRVEKIDSLPVFFHSAEEDLNNVRIVPQIHKILGIK